MSRSADDKRWAIAPPPSPQSSAISGRMNVEDAAESSRRRPRMTEGERARRRERVVTSSEVKELEPSDSDRVTEGPPASLDDEGSRDTEFETIPAPAWVDTDED